MMQWKHIGCEKKGKIGEIYNICGKEKISVGEFLKTISYSKMNIQCKLDRNLETRYRSTNIGCKKIL